MSRGHSGAATPVTTIDLQSMLGGSNTPRCVSVFLHGTLAFPAPFPVPGLPRGCSVFSSVCSSRCQATHIAGRLIPRCRCLGQDDGASALSRRQTTWLGHSQRSQLARSGVGRVGTPAPHTGNAARRYRGTSTTVRRSTSRVPHIMRLLCRLPNRSRPLHSFRLPLVLRDRA